MCELLHSLNPLKRYAFHTPEGKSHPMLVKEFKKQKIMMAELLEKIENQRAGLHKQVQDIRKEQSMCLLQIFAVKIILSL